jgi:WD40 repeat protein
VAFSHDGDQIAVVCLDGSIYLFDFHTRERLGDRLIVSSRRTTSVAFSPKGGTLAVANEDGEIGLFDTMSRQLVDRLTGHFGAVNKVAFSPDGDVLASAGKDGTIRLWDMTERRPLGGPLVGFPGEIADVAFDRGGATLVSGGAAGLLLWDVGVNSWLDRACRIVGRNLSRREWQQYVGGSIPYERTCSTLPPGGGS